MPKSRKKINFPHHRFIETSRRYAVICAGRGYKRQISPIPKFLGILKLVLEIDGGNREFVIEF